MTDLNNPNRLRTAVASATFRARLSPAAYRAHLTSMRECSVLARRDPAGYRRGQLVAITRRIEAALARRPFSRTELFLLTARNQKPQFDEALTLLTARGRIGSRQETTRGRTRTIWYAGPVAPQQDADERRLARVTDCILARLAEREHSATELRNLYGYQAAFDEALQALVAEGRVIVRTEPPRRTPTKAGGIKGRRGTVYSLSEPEQDGQS